MTKEELIGRQAEIAYGGVLFKGTIIDETKNMLHLKTKKGVKAIVKKNARIKIGKATVEGKEIAKRPEDRIKHC